jgi:uncharacterized protein YggE
MRSLIAIAAGVAVVALLAGSAPAGSETAAAAAAGHSIVVAGSGSVATMPNRARVSFGVTTTAKSAAAALRANGAEMAKVIAAVKAQGIAAADIRTESVSLSTRTSPNGDEIVGYTASNSVGVTLRALDKVGAVIDAAVGAGANEVSGPSLVRADADAIYRQALRAAIANARAKAQAIARASGLALRRITAVTEGSSGPPVPAATAKADSASTPIEPGTELVEATVTVTFSAA